MGRGSTRKRLGSAFGALASVALVAAACSNPGTLRFAAEARNIYFGSAAEVRALRDDPDYVAVSGREFDMLTPTNALKWDATEPQPGTFTFGPADVVLDAAASVGQRVRGHTLVWHSQIPSWVANGPADAATVGAALDRHIAGVAGHYQGRIYAWDVVNEAFEGNGTRRQSIFQQALGDGYIARALQAARRADGAARLYINDYGTEGRNAKSDALYNLVRQLRADGVPIDGVGFQGHFVIGQIPGDLQANLQRFADLGVDVAVTELDIRMAADTEANRAQQARDYAIVTRACLAVSRCAGISLWDFTDRYSWLPYGSIPEGWATPWDRDLQPKPAVAAIATALAAA
jgi:endo-1,4-beta-xylanase